MEKRFAEVLLGVVCLASLGDAFVPTSIQAGSSLASRHWGAFSKPVSGLSVKEASNSYDFDESEEVEQRLGNSTITVEMPIIDDESEEESPLNGASASRYDDLIASVGLKGKLKHAQDLPAQRKVSCFDVFCNRELRYEYISAIGFDMDYTLVQYKQPAFDKLAFDGAKEKLVNKLGYPKEVLDFEYDHEVRKIYT